MFEILTQLLDNDTIYIRKDNNIYKITKDFTSVGTTKAILYIRNNLDMCIADKMLDTIENYLARIYADGDSIIIAIHF